VYMIGHYYITDYVVLVLLQVVKPGIYQIVGIG
jgi:hypothetical protein